MKQRDLLFDIWGNLYPGISSRILENFLLTVEVNRTAKGAEKDQIDWYKDAVVYSLYADLLNTDFAGLTLKLDYLHNLGINCIWLLPVLDSPMRDAGFDISDYYSIRAELAGGEGADKHAVFSQFLAEAHNRGIRVIFDIAMNHTSDDHHWFREARKSKDNPYRNYYIWSSDNTQFAKARIIFKGIEKSNWEPCDGEYYFHRFLNSH